MQKLPKWVRQTAVYLIFALLLLSCQLSESISEELTSPTPTVQAPVEEIAEAVQEVEVATATAAPVRGQSRAEPYSGETAVTLNDWEIEIIDTVRGEKAWHLISAANQFNDPAPDGWEYLLIRYKIKNLRQEEEESSIGLYVTGSGNVIHYSFNNSAVAPDPALETYLLGDNESDGWDAYLIHTGEDNLMVVVDTFDFDTSDLFIALDEDASLISNKELLESISPTLTGTEPNEPALVGNLVTSEDWQLLILEAYTGEEAWERIFEANQFNAPPEYGSDYVLVKLRIHYIGSNDAGENLSSYNSMFALLDKNGVALDQPSIVEPEPELRGHLFPNGEMEGWLVFQAPETEVKSVHLLFQPRHNLVGNLRYLSLLDYGR